jgi:DNA-binding transcriptional MocR family regulator
MAFTHDFAIVPHELYDHEHLSSTSRLVYVCLCRYRTNTADAPAGGALGTTFPSVDSLSEWSRLSRAKVIQGIRELEAFGCIDVEKRKSGTHVNNVYYLPEPEDWLPDKRAAAYVQEHAARAARMRDLSRKRKVSTDTDTYSGPTAKQKVGTDTDTPLGTGTDTPLGTDTDTVPEDLSEELSKELHRKRVLEETLKSKKHQEELSLQRQFIGEGHEDFNGYENWKRERLGKRVAKGAEFYE